MIQFQKKRDQLFKCFSNPSAILQHWFLMTPIILSGCMGIYEGGFECPPGKGLGCTSISEVNEWVNQSQVINHQASEENSCHNCTSHSDGKPMNSDDSIWYSPWATSNQNPYSHKSNMKLFDAQDSI